MVHLGMAVEWGDIKTHICHMIISLSYEISYDSNDLDWCHLLELIVIFGDLDLDFQCHFILIMLPLSCTLDLNITHASGTQLRD